MPIAAVYHLKTKKMCEKAVENKPETLEFVPEHLKTQEICKEAIYMRPWPLLLPDWFVTQQQIDVWYDDHYWYDNDKLIEWYEGYQKRKAQKAKIKEELLPIAWHPLRWWDWCVPNNEKQGIENFFFEHMISVPSIKLSKNVSRNI